MAKFHGEHYPWRPAQIVRVCLVRGAYLRRAVGPRVPGRDVDSPSPPSARAVLLGPLKIAISVPDRDFHRFERTASRHGMNRSEFYRRAAEHLADQLEGTSELTPGWRTPHSPRQASRRRTASSSQHPSGPRRRTRSGDLSRRRRLGGLRPATRKRTCQGPRTGTPGGLAASGGDQDGARRTTDIEPEAGGVSREHGRRTRFRDVDTAALSGDPGIFSRISGTR